MNRWLRFLFGGAALAVAFAVGNLALRAETVSARYQTA